MSSTAAEKICFSVARVRCFQEQEKRQLPVPCPSNTERFNLPSGRSAECPVPTRSLRVQHPPCSNSLGWYTGQVGHPQRGYPLGVRRDIWPTLPSTHCHHVLCPTGTPYNRAWCEGILIFFFGGSPNASAQCLGRINTPRGSTDRFAGFSQQNTDEDCTHTPQGHAPRGRIGGTAVMTRTLVSPPHPCCMKIAPAPAQAANRGSWNCGGLVGTLLFIRVSERPESDRRPTTWFTCHFPGLVSIHRKLFSLVCEKCASLIVEPLASGTLRIGWCPSAQQKMVYPARLRRFLAGIVGGDDGDIFS